MLTVILLPLSLQGLPQAAGELNPRMFWIEWVKHPVGRLIRSAKTMALSLCSGSSNLWGVSVCLCPLSCMRAQSIRKLFPSQFFKQNLFDECFFVEDKRARCLLMLTFYTGMVSTLRSQLKLIGEDTAGVRFTINPSLTNDSQQIPYFLPCKLTNPPMFHPII